MATKDKRKKVSVAFSGEDRSLNEDRYQEDDKFNHTMFYPPSGYDWEFTKDTFSSYRDIFDSIKIKEPMGKIHYVTFDFKISGKEIFPVPFSSRPDQDYDKFINSLRVALDKWNYRDIEKDEHDRLIKYMKTKSVRVGNKKDLLGNIVEEIHDNINSSL